MSKIVSPNEMFSKGKEMMLKGTDPQTYEDWSRLAHFWAYNVESSTLPASLELLCLIFKSPLKAPEIAQIANHYKQQAVKRQEEALAKMVGKPVTPNHLQYLRSILSKELELDNIIQVFKKAGLDASWPDMGDWNKWGKLCKSLFSFTASEFKNAQLKMAKIIEEGDGS